MNKYLLFCYLLAFFLFNGLIAQNESFQLNHVACDLEQPWEITYGPDNHLWVTESRAYKLLRIDPNTGNQSVVLDATFLKNFPNTQNPWPQGGFTGVALHPQLLSGQPYVYVAYVNEYNGCLSNNEGCDFRSKIARYDYNPATGTVSNEQVVLDNIPGSTDHNGGRLTIGDIAGTPYLFYSVGDMGAGQFSNANRANNAQDENSYEGKILRLQLEPVNNSWIPNDNPFGNAVWTLGHRNPQGLVFGDNGTLYASEHGPFTDDELNIINTGKNYGHPLVSGFADGNYNGAAVGTGQYLPLINNEVANANAIANYQDPIDSYYDAPNSEVTSWYNYAINGTQPFPNAWLYRPSIAPCGIDFYGSTTIPGWQNSILITTLKKATIYRVKLSADGQAVDGELIPYFEGLGRFRDVAISPDGTKIYAACDKYGATSGPSQGTAISPNNPGCILEFEYSPNLVGCQNSYDGFTLIGEHNNAKYFISNTGTNWANGAALAKFHKGYLASPNDNAENEFIRTYLAANNEIAFIGVTDADTEGTFALDSGEPLTFNNFSDQNAEDDDYGIMNFWDGSWSVNNLGTQRKFVMEIPCSTTCPDNDGDGICANDDCNDNDANFPMTPGTACNDFDIFTENDVIQANGCFCSGTTITTYIVLECPTDINLTLQNSNTTAVANWNTAVPNTNCPSGITVVNQVSGPLSGSPLNEGTYTVSYEASNGCGNTEICSFVITVNPNTTNPTCSDGIQNQGETGVDCGGPCSPCPTECNISVSSADGNINITGLTGAENAKLFDSNTTSVWGCNPWNGDACSTSESISGLVEGDTYYLSVQSSNCNEWISIVVIGGANTETCDDGIQNQGETGVDCGGPCVACPTCDDGIQNQSETGVDCGGPCVACPTCDDGIQNQGETGIDCGGPCSPCSSGCNISYASSNGAIIVTGLTGAENAQLFDSGIASVWGCNPWNGNVCMASETISGLDDGATYYLSIQSDNCSEWIPIVVEGDGNTPTCDDGIQNQGETGVDCGGPCVACATCDDGIQNQGETGVDCGGPCIPCSSGCNVSVASSNGNINIFGLSEAENAKLFDASITPVWECNPWNGSICTNNETVTSLVVGATYFLSIQSANCSEWIPVVVEGDVTCTDSDNDGVCNDEDCEPNNPNLPTATNTPCDDLNANTENDVILSDGCTCEGTMIPDGCNVEITSTNGGVTITGLASSANTKLFDANSSIAWACDPWNGSPCSNVEMVSGLTVGATYYLAVQSEFCNEWIPVVIQSGSTLADLSLRKNDSNKDSNLSSSLSNFERYKIFPNPSKNEVFVQVGSEIAEDISFSIYDFMGNLVIEKSCAIEVGDNFIETDISNLKNGSYVVVLRSKTQSQTKRFVKINTY